MGKTSSYRPPFGQTYAIQIKNGKRKLAKEQAEECHQGELFSVAENKFDAGTYSAFLHSALCAMSLPITRPKGEDEFKPLVRTDGHYTLAINPKPVLVPQDPADPSSPLELRSLGLPFGSYPRIILISILSQAVKKQSRHVYLGGSFQEMMRLFGFENASRGKDRGQTDRLVEQLDRLLACEWMMRFDESDPVNGISAFEIHETKLTHNYAGLNHEDGRFTRELVLSESFYNQLVAHAVRFDLSAVHALRRKPTAIDLYTYLSYRLPRIPAGKPVVLTFKQLLTHLGNNIQHDNKIKQTVINNLDLVSAVYPEARVEIGDKTVRLYHSSKAIPDAIRVVESNRMARPAKNKPVLNVVASSSLVFPHSFLHVEKGDGFIFYEIAKELNVKIHHDTLAEKFRLTSNASLVGADLLDAWKAFCMKHADKDLDTASVSHKA